MNKAVLQMGDVLMKTGAERIESIRKSAAIDSNLKESLTPAIRANVRPLLAKYEYPPDVEEMAVKLALEQAEIFATGEPGGQA